jgi:hypothetical protein
MKVCSSALRRRYVGAYAFPHLLQARCQRKVERFSDKFETLVAYYQGEAAGLEGSARELRAKQKELRDSSEESMLQKGLFSKLEQLLEAKLKCAGAERVEDSGQVPGQDRLVISS